MSGPISNTLSNPAVNTNSTNGTTFTNVKHSAKKAEKAISKGTIFHRLGQSLSRLCSNIKKLFASVGGHFIAKMVRALNPCKKKHSSEKPKETGGLSNSDKPGLGKIDKSTSADDTMIVNSDLLTAPPPSLPPQGWPAIKGAADEFSATNNSAAFEPKNIKNVAKNHVNELMESALKFKNRQKQNEITSSQNTDFKPEMTCSSSPNVDSSKPPSVAAKSPPPVAPKPSRSLRDLLTLPISPPLPPPSWLVSTDSADKSSATNNSEILSRSASANQTRASSKDEYVAFLEMIKDRRKDMNEHYDDESKTKISNLPVGEVKAQPNLDTVITNETENMELQSSLSSSKREATQNAEPIIFCAQDLQERKSKLKSRPKVDEQTSVLTHPNKSNQDSFAMGELQIDLKKVFNKVILYQGDSQGDGQGDGQDDDQEW